jgi:hypothetical protein
MDRRKMLECEVVRHWWPDSSRSVRVWSLLMNLTLYTVWNAFMDLVTALFPAYMVWRLQLKISTKWGLSFLMGGESLYVLHTTSLTSALLILG